MSLVSGNQTKSFKYVYELPYAERKLLCNILDINDQWERLGGEMMGFSIIDLHEFKRAEKSGESPTDRLLQFWGRKNNTILDLYFLLYSMEHFQATNVLLPFIPPEYHYKNLEAQLHDNVAPVMEQAAFVPNNHVPPPPPPEPNPHLLRDLRPQRRVLPNPPNQSFSETQAQSQLTSRTEPNSVRPALSSVKVPSQKTFEQSVADVPQVASGVTSRATSIAEKSAVPTVKILNTSIPPGRTEEKEKASYSLQNNLEALQSPPEKFTTKQCTPKACGSKREKSAEFSEPSRSVSENGSGEGRERKNPEPPRRDRHQSNSSNGSVISDCSVTMISFKELENASDYWNKSQILGSGGFGEVYKGRWYHQNVAIKKIKPKNRNDHDSFSASITQIIDELKYLQSYRHFNILQIYGFSADPGKPHCLVYEFMANGSLEYRLLCKKVEAFSDSPPDPLNWRQRFDIARGTAAALQFLHTVKEKPLIHGDVKSANILLDTYFQPKLGDFGLAREGPPLNDLTSMKVSRVQGTPHYVPPEYLKSHKLSTKVDTYSFGIVLFEICSGRRAYNSSNKRYLKDEAFDTKDKYSLRDPKGGFECNKVFDILFAIGLACAEDNPKKRPDMTTVFQDLENSKKILPEDWNRRLSGGEYRFIGSQQDPSVNSFPSTTPTSGLRPNLAYWTDRTNLTPIPQHFSPPQSIHPLNPSWNRPGFMMGHRLYPYPVPVNEGLLSPFIHKPNLLGGIEQPTRKCTPNSHETTNRNVAPIPRFSQLQVKSGKCPGENSYSSSTQDVESSQQEAPNRNVAPIPRFSQLLVKPGKCPGENSDSSSTQDVESSQQEAPNRNVAPIPRFSQLLVKPGKCPGENSDSSSTQDLESSHQEAPNRNVAPIPRFSQLMIKPGKDAVEDNDSSSQTAEPSSQEIPCRSNAPIPQFSQLLNNSGRDSTQNNNTHSQSTKSSSQKVHCKNGAANPRPGQSMMNPEKDSSANDSSFSKISESSTSSNSHSSSYSSSEVSERQMQATSVVSEERRDLTQGDKEKKTKVVSAQGKKFLLI